MGFKKKAVMGLCMALFYLKSPVLADEEESTPFSDFPITFTRDYIDDYSIDYWTFEDVDSSDKSKEAAKRVMGFFWGFPEELRPAMKKSNFLETWMGGMRERMLDKYPDLEIMPYQIEYDLMDNYYIWNHEELEDLDLGPVAGNACIDALVHHYRWARSTHKFVGSVRDKLQVRTEWWMIKFRGGLELDSEYDAKGKVKIKKFPFLDRIEYGRSENEEDLELILFANGFCEIGFSVERKIKEENNKPEFYLLIKSR